MARILAFADELVDTRFLRLFPGFRLGPGLGLGLVLGLD